MHCGIAGDIVDPIDSCYYTLGGIHLHGVSRVEDDAVDEEAEPGTVILGRFSVDIQFVAPTPTSPAQMLITIRYIGDISCYPGPKSCQ